MGEVYYMIQVDLPAAFAVGQIFSVLSSDYLKKTPEKFSNKLLGPLNFYLSCGFVPTGMYLLAAYPAWEAMYVTNWVENTYNRPSAAAFYVAFMVAMILLGNTGFILGHYWYQNGKDKWVIYGSVAGVILTIMPFLLKWGVWMQIGTYADIQANRGYSFFNMPFFGGWLAFISYIAITTIIAGIWFKQKGNKM